MAVYFQEAWRGPDVVLNDPQALAAVAKFRLWNSPYGPQDTFLNYGNPAYGGPTLELARTLPLPDLPTGLIYGYKVQPYERGGTIWYGTPQVNDLRQEPSQELLQLRNWSILTTGQRVDSGQRSIFDSVFGGKMGQWIVSSLNPISGIKTVTEINNGGMFPTLSENLANPPEVDYGTLGVKAGLNVAGSVGIAAGVEGISQGISGYLSATTPLGVGVQGPVNPGLWETLSSGNLVGSWDILAAPISGLYHAPQIGWSGTNAIGLGQVINEGVNLIVGAFGEVGKGLINLVTGNFVQAAQNFGLTKSPQQNATFFEGGPSTNYGSGGGGGGGGGYSPTGQMQSNSLVLPLVIVVIIGLVLVLLRRK